MRHPRQLQAFGSLKEERIGPRLVGNPRLLCWPLHPISYRGARAPIHPLGGLVGPSPLLNGDIPVILRTTGIYSNVARVERCPLSPRLRLGLARGLVGWIPPCLIVFAVLGSASLPGSQAYPPTYNLITQQRHQTEGTLIRWAKSRSPRPPFEILGFLCLSYPILSINFGNGLLHLRISYSTSIHRGLWNCTNSLHFPMSQASVRTEIKDRF